MDSRIVELRSLADSQTRKVEFPLEFRAADPEVDSEAFKLAGHAAVFDRKSDDLGGFREIIKRGAFRKALDENQDVVALWEHDARFLLGRSANNTLKMHEDPRGLNTWVSVADTSYARDLRVLLDRGDVSQMSFGFIVGEQDWQIKRHDDGSEEVVRHIISVERLFDVSVVALPAYPQTDAAARSSSTHQHGPDESELREVAVAGDGEQLDDAVSAIAADHLVLVALRRRRLDLRLRH